MTRSCCTASPRQTLLLAVVLLSCLAITGCGRKPSTLEPPDNATTYTYPPLDQKP